MIWQQASNLSVIIVPLPQPPNISALNTFIHSSRRSHSFSHYYYLTQKRKLKNNRQTTEKKRHLLWSTNSYLLVISKNQHNKGTKKTPDTAVHMNGDKGSNVAPPRESLLPFSSFPTPYTQQHTPNTHRDLQLTTTQINHTTTKLFNRGTNEENG